MATEPTSDPRLGDSHLSEVASRYLEAIFYIDAEGEEVRSARLADWLAVSRPTVAVTLRRMERDGLLQLSPSKAIVLTERGRRLAAAIVRRHRIIERWLTDVLGLDWIEADEEAARLEHAVSEAVENRLFELLGRPTTCPHGNPIPGVSERDPAEISLDRLEVGRSARISRVSEVAEREIPVLLGYLQERGLGPGQRLKTIEVDPLNQLLRIRAGRREVSISVPLATKLWVVPEP